MFCLLSTVPACGSSVRPVKCSLSTGSANGFKYAIVELVIGRVCLTAPIPTLLADCNFSKLEPCAADQSPRPASAAPTELIPACPRFHGQLISPRAVISFLLKNPLTLAHSLATARYDFSARRESVSSPQFEQKSSKSYGLNLGRQESTS